MKKRLIALLIFLVALFVVSFTPACSPTSGEQQTPEEEIAWYLREDDRDPGLVFGMSSDTAFIGNQVTQVENNINLNYKWLTEEQ